MSSAKSPKFWRLLAFRLTLWYGGVLAVYSLLSFLIFYLVVVSAMRARTDADLEHEALRCGNALQSGGWHSLEKQITDSAHSSGVNDIFFRVYDQGGKLLTSSDIDGWRDTALPAIQFPFVPLQQNFVNAAGVGHHNMVRVMTEELPGGDVLQVGMTVQDDVRVATEARRIISVVTVGTAALAIAVGWLLARRALTGVEQVTSTAREISLGALGRRVPKSGSGDEIDQLATTFNQMLERIQALVKGMEETNDNIAHELRGPVTRIRGLAETTLTGNATQHGFEEMAASTVEECDRLLVLINTMLDIAEAEAGVMQLNLAPVNLAAMLRELCDLYEPVAAQNDINMSMNLPAQSVTHGDLQKLQRVFANLLDNALKYTPPKGRVDIACVGANSHVEVTISNSGKGIYPQDLPHIFERFYRGDRSRSEPGNGLGLSLAQAIVFAHGGRIAVTSTPGEKTNFTVILAAASVDNKN